MAQGIWGSPWAGLKYFDKFFSYYNFGAILGNTIWISLYAIAVGFFFPIVLALLLDEIRNLHFKKLIQNVTYVPHFLSGVVVVGMLINFTSIRGGLFNKIIELFGGHPVNFMIESQYFKTMYVFSDLWQNMGWSAIIYLAALTGISPELNEAAVVDGASRFKRILHVKIPGLLPTIMILLILRVGHLFNIGFERILLMQNDANLSASDVIQTYIYRTGILQGDFSYSTAVSVFNSLANFIILIAANYLARKTSDSSLW
nr:ABC transporter permease subunit [Cohnella zeiphila]